MSRSEADYKRRIVAAMQKYGGYARRVEDKYAVGTLDLILSTPRTGLVLAEAKLIKHVDGSFAASPRQCVEMTRIRQGGGVTLLIGISSEGHFYLTEHTAAKKDGCIGGDRFPETFEWWFKQRIENV